LNVVFGSEDEGAEKDGSIETTSGGELEPNLGEGVGVSVGS
jgi:hypothetical protein